LAEVAAFQWEICPPRLRFREICDETAMPMAWRIWARLRPNRREATVAAAITWKLAPPQLRLTPWAALRVLHGTGRVHAGGGDRHIHGVHTAGELLREDGALACGLHVIHGAEKRADQHALPHQGPVILGPLLQPAFVNGIGFG